jgi:chromosome segregation ATPase
MSGKRDAYIEKSTAQLNKWNAEIDELEEKARRVGAEAKAEFRSQIAIVRAKRSELEGNIAKLRQAGDSAWKDLKEGIESSRKALDKAFHSAASNFR